ncbi:MAG: MFS transporter, partial [Pseudomonadota bacterium]
MNFILLMLARMVSDTGSGIQAVIMPLYIIDTGGSPAAVGLFSFLSLVPALLAYPFAGVLGDRLDRKKIMVACDISSGAITLALAITAYYGRMSLILLLSSQVLVSLLYGFFDPAVKGMLPRLVPEKELTKANSKVASLRILTGLAGPVVGAALYSKLGITALFAVNGISFLLSAFIELLISFTHNRQEAKAVQGILTDLTVGIRFVADNKAIRKLCTFLLVIYAFIQPVFTVVLPLFFRLQLEYTDTQYGYLQMAMLLGALLGSILVGLLFGKEKKFAKALITGCSLLIGSILTFAVLILPHSLSMLGGSSPLYFVLLSGTLCLLSTAVMLINVPAQTFIQRKTPDEYMSRIFSIV